MSYLLLQIYLADGKFLQVVCRQDRELFRNFDRVSDELNLEKLRRTLLKDKANVSKDLGVRKICSLHRLQNQST